MALCSGKKSKKLANRTLIPGGGHITGRALLILKSLPMLCWLSRSTRTSVSGWQYHAGYHSRETHWEATRRLRYCLLYKGLFRCLFLSNRVFVVMFSIMKSVKDVRAHCYCASLVRTLFIGHARATSFSSARTESKT